MNRASEGWPRRAHHLTFAFPVPGGERAADGWRVQWTGCAVMGVLNVTPDSFSDGGRHATLEAAVAQARAMRDGGALLIDVGGESTRPGAEPVPAEQELDRVRPVLQALAGEGVLLSVDTLKAEVAAGALAAGAHLINDVNGLRDPAMLRVCAEAGAPACIMHMQGEPRTMQQAPHYEDVVGEVHAFLLVQAQAALAAGVPSVLLDPGLGFGKTLAHNLALLRALPELTAGPFPVLVGASRKRLIDYLAGVPRAADRDPGSLALHLYAARQGAALVRAHAAGAHVQALRVEAALDDRAESARPLESPA
ncbi:dihydropteroate synthase [Deinococcus metallilatus]|uniref:Dihydropteroate synthase n=1 Tax=Deinococcus metallilatus TaxID=1211322 RepID=A0AAJ5F395_9DEIO|nr:dihydropteroate synthase [Deinococcus metallilatus]MBB5295611.1 dihydropteroate synthase [Deinococcus metallilatus]QBY07881.1 dihydropteroate synthase [Deinococcus metallilatus]RXJ12774.1 dihydropteroate synthase [Deinococcus metallilatus]TLK27304.1 dihydropteroate synthase [Deinococcus metallilatus]GMA16290.1 dihydropteroate synthase [Deinococcus metallilatus]